jgi:predicted DsbA family dithiol-disulfide isomerase
VTTWRPELRVSVFSDYICPFCYIGSRRLLRLNELFDVQVNWCGLEIHPQTPPQGMAIERLGYSHDQWQRMMEGLRQMATEEHIDITPHNFTTNSRRALLLAEAAKNAGREIFYALHERLFGAFFTEGQNIGDEQVLRALAKQSDVPSEVVEAAWVDSRYAERLELNRRHAAELGITGTPAFVFGRRIIVGAVPCATLLEAARQVTESQS